MTQKKEYLQYIYQFKENINAKEILFRKHIS